VKEYDLHVGLDVLFERPVFVVDRAGTVPEIRIVLNGLSDSRAR
jgi:hypothetical protein